MEENLKGLGLFASSIIHLISIGKQENFNEIEQHIENADIVEYLYEKYRDHFYVHFDGSMYNNQQINAYFSRYAGYLEGNEERKFGVVGYNNGLLVLLAMLNDIIEDNAVNWHMDIR